MTEEKKEGEDLKLPPFPTGPVNPRLYNIQDWYWQVGDDTKQFWSSKMAGFVPASNKDFIEWSKSGPPTQIGSIEELKQVVPEGFKGP